MGDTRFGKPAEEGDLDWEKLSAPVPMDLIDPEFPTRPAGEPAVPPAPERMAEGESRPEAAATPPGATLFGIAALQDEFSRIRAEMEAEAEAEKRKKAEAEREEASQLARLEQWMANARARLLKADADLAGPAGRVRIRRESSPSLYRLAEMQKTMHMVGDATQADGTRVAPKPEPVLDPMATLSVPTEQFLTLDAPPQPTLRAQALARQAAQQAAQQAAVHARAEAKAQVAQEMADAPAPARSVRVPSPVSQVHSNNAGDLTAYRPMTREEALTRKVAKLRKVAEAGDNTLALAPAPEEDGDERTALHYAIAGVVLVAILVLGLGLFAATQAGLFDGLEDRIPFLRPKIASLARPAKPAAAPPVTPVTPAATTPAAAPVPALRIPGPSAVPPAPAKGAAARPAPAYAEIPPDNQPAPARNAAVTPKAARARIAHAVPAPRKASAPVPAAAPAPEAAPADGAIPAYAKPRSKASNPGEIILRNSVQAAANIDKDDLQELYNRYALGFPGLSGEIVVGLTVDPGGRILEGSIVSSTTGVEAFDQELLRKVMDWRLRAFPDTRPQFISVPFLFPQQGGH